MMKNYVRTDNQKNPISKIISMMIVLIFIISLVFPGVIPYLISRIISPISNLSANVSDSGLTALFKSKISLQKENDNLKEKVFRLEALTLENEFTRNEYLSIINASSSIRESIIGKIIRRPPLTPYDSFIVELISDGSKLKKGDKVFAYNSSYIGEVDEVNYRFVKVILFSSPGRSYVVSVGTSTLSVEALALGNGTFEAKIPRDERISVGDVVHMASVSPIVFGRVEAVVDDPSSPFIYAMFRTPVNLNYLKIVNFVANE